MTDRVMLDIETLGLEPGASIVAIGAVRFDADGLGDTFQESISLTSCQKAGLTIDAETLEWWLTQDELAKDQLTGGSRLGPALRDFAEWYADADEIWANSPSFDCEILKHAYDAVGLEEPWNFYRERDFRTLKSFDAAPEPEQAGVEHDALDDAVHQAEIAAETLSRLNERELVTDGGCVEADAEIVMMYDNGKSWKEIRDRFDIPVGEAMERYRAEKYDHWDTGWELGPADAQTRFETGAIDVWGDGEATVQIEEIFDSIPLTLVAEDDETRTLVQANLSAEQARTLGETLLECADIREGNK